MDRGPSPSPSRDRRRSREYLPPSLRSGTSGTDWIAEKLARIRGGIGRTQVANAYEQVPAIYRAVQVIAGALVDGELGVYRKVDGQPPGGKDQRVLSGPAVELIENPTGDPESSDPETAPVLTKEDFLYTIAAQSMLHRSAGILVLEGKTSGRPVRLLPLPPESLRLLYPATDPWTTVGWSFSALGKTLPLRPREAVRFKFAPDPYDFRDGVGPGIPAQMAADTRHAATLYNKHALENGGSLGGILQFDDAEALDERQVAEVRRRFEERHGGPTNAERVAVISGRYKWIPTGANARDMQFRDLATMTLEDIIRPFGLSVFFFGVTDHAGLSRATVLTEKASLYYNMLFQVARRYAAVFTSIVRRIDSNLYCWWDFSNVDALKDDVDAKLDRGQKLLDQGVPLATVAADLDYPITQLPPEADVALISANKVTVESVVAAGAAAALGPAPGEALPTEASGGGSGPAPLLQPQHIQQATQIVKDVHSGAIPRDAGQAALEQLFGMSAEAASALLGSAGEKEPPAEQAQLPPPPPSGKAAPAQLQAPTEEAQAAGRSLARALAPAPDLRARAWWSYVRGVQPYENAITTAYRKTMMKLRAKVLAAIDDSARAGAPEHARAGGITGTDVKSAAGDAFDSKAFADGLRPSIRSAFAAAGRRQADALVDLGVIDDSRAKAEKDRLPKLSDTYWGVRSGRLVSVGDDKRALVMAAVQEGMDLGLNLSDLKDLVRGVFNEELSDANAQRIARTESHTAANAGRFGMMRETGVEKLEWLSSRDELVRELHQIDGEVVVLGEAFSNGLQFPGDPAGDAGNVINCRCTALPVSDEFAAFEAETQNAAWLDARETEVWARSSSEDLARRALYLGVDVRLPAVARRVPELLARALKAEAPDGEDALAVLRDRLDVVMENAAAASAVRLLGGTLFASLWAVAFGPPAVRVEAVA